MIAAPIIKNLNGNKCPQCKALKSLKKHPDGLECWVCGCIIYHDFPLMHIPNDGWALSRRKWKVL